MVKFRQLMNVNVGQCGTFSQAFEAERGNVWAAGKAENAINKSRFNWQCNRTLSFDRTFHRPARHFLKLISSLYCHLAGAVQRETL